MRACAPTPDNRISAVPGRKATSANAAFFLPPLPPLSYPDTPAALRTGRAEVVVVGGWRLVRGEQICHPISDCSSILFSPPFLRALQPLHILALSPAPPSASPLLLPLRRPSLFSHPYPHRTFHSHIFVNPPDRQLRTPSPTFSLSLCFILSPFSFPISPSLIHFLSPSLLLWPCEGVGGGGGEREGGGAWLSWSKMNF